jgi:hypothetical protein
LMWRLNRKIRAQRDVPHARGTHPLITVLAHGKDRDYA